MFEVQQATAGEWAVVAAGGRALLVATTDRAALVRFHRAVRTGFAETLDALVADGLSRTPAFGLLETNGAGALLAVRGTVHARVGEPEGERELRASTVSSWLETPVDRAASVTLGDAIDGDGLPLADGVVRANGVAWRVEAADPAPAPATQTRITEPVLLEAEAFEDDAPKDDEPALEHAAAADPTPADVPAQIAVSVEPVSVGAGEATAVDAPTRIPESTIAEAPERDAPEEHDPGYDHLFGATMMRGIEEAAVRPDAADEDAGQESGRIDLPGFITDSFPSPSAVGDHDGLTVFSGDLPPRRPTEPGATPAVVDAPIRYRLSLSDGRTEELAAPVIVGRAPSAGAFPALRGARPVTLTGAEDDISRSHVAIAVEGDTVVVTDLHSRNGTMVLLPGKTPQKLRAGEPTTVVAGTIVDLGSGATLTVEAGA
ncbi:FHA domain-containing protein [Leifsonia sp. NPDC080035]|uniref:FHA domain-containing protein n=1 Tax=Leifsonia sp. NPDC080035 TaxID=3143936 RepID=A0AAU7G9G4_9MICO